LRYFKAYLPLSTIDKMSTGKDENLDAMV
jgi:hypothetical protein